MVMGMIRKTEKIKLQADYKAKAMSVIDKTINSVAVKQRYELSEQEKRKIKNLSLDQVNMNITHKAKAKTIWVFDVEDHLPVIVETEDISKLKAIDKDTRSYKMRPNLSWTYNRKNTNEGGVSYEEFVSENLRILMEDFETAAFYGAFSYVTEGELDAE